MIAIWLGQTLCTDSSKGSDENSTHTPFQLVKADYEKSKRLQPTRIHHCGYCIHRTMILSLPYMLVLSAERLLRQTRLVLVVRKKELVRNVISLVVALTLVFVTFKRQRRAKLSFKPYKRRRKRWE